MAERTLLEGRDQLFQKCPPGKRAGPGFLPPG
jgi:hypothetical protein